ncbi:SAP domain-containing protein [Paenibacillus hamazuiensis]|uniref:SAP domain-containing protein n=1 Tax=Paenibacillus hamazuiensis TaxID=2936508 RepID=UPI00200C2929|nr:SAP domain-containing protein [Paenibacillus hamazuiensis]
MTSNDRPTFSKHLSVQEFEKHYWYKNELTAICGKCNLPVSGTKAELEERIKKWLSGEKITDPRKANSAVRKKQELQELKLSTRLIADGFKFNRQAREFFANYYNKPKFSFTKEMAAALREAERQNDMEMTVADLIEVYEGRRNPDNLEERTYQWNGFVKDFNRDPRTKNMKDRMKIAAELWKKVRDNPGPKQYSPELLDKLIANMKED